MRSNVLVLQAFESDYYSLIQRSFDTFNDVLPKFPNKIAIKLNLCTIRPSECGDASHPVAIDELLAFLRDKYGYSPLITLVESDTLARKIGDVYKALGTLDIAKKYKAICANLSTEEYVTHEINGLYFSELPVPKTIVESDLFISFAKLKTLSRTKITCALKNQFGCIPYKNKAKFHIRIDEVIVDANLAYRPNLFLVDGIIGLGGTGIPKRYGVFVASDDPVATDCVCAQLLGFNPLFIGHVRKAARRRLGRMSYEVIGADIEKLRLEAEFPKANFYLSKIYRLLGGKAML